MEGPANSLARCGLLCGVGARQGGESRGQMLRLCVMVLVMVSECKRTGDRYVGKIN